MAGGEVLALTHSTAVSIIADRNGNFALFVTPSLGAGGGLGLLSGWTGSFYPTAGLNDIEGGGISGVVFWAPPTGGPSWSVEGNYSLADKGGITVNPGLGTTYGAGGGGYIEGTYTFFLIKDNASHISNQTYDDFESTLGWTEEQVDSNISSLLENLELELEKYNQPTPEIPPEVKETLPSTSNEVIKDVIDDLFKLLLNTGDLKEHSKNEEGNEFR